MSDIALPTLSQPSSLVAPADPSAEWLRAARRARQLSWLSLVWMAAEGAIAIIAGILAGSIALVGFGIDSAIEGFASLVIVWRFTGHRLLSHAAEKRAQKLVAFQFFVLAPYVAYEAIQHLAASERPEVSALGMALTATSLVGMPFLGLAKRRLAVTLGSSATHGEGSQNLICAYLAGAVFLGLAGNALLGWWWLDPLAALLVAGVAVREGARTWRGEGCCAPMAGIDAAPACGDACREPAGRSAGIGADGTGIPIADCRLDPDGLSAQRDRYRAIGHHLDRLDRGQGRLDAWLAPAVDLEVVAKAIEIERGCCPFLAVRFDATERRLSVSVGDPAHDPALDAIRHALTGAAD